ncbi:hypothetical protein AK812_SmicGene7018 [Symbiodinium microadriaticum]|uniref:Uncharacterized protein n=1 Tax=Symbiodinium microadriaticum TaxID=2951 RepID=A0A1Q9EPG3_SYMMI|nr:hypothetical protein AK812_SmicGene7018 [Symbiodinium microadriaticum]
MDVRMYQWGRRLLLWADLLRQLVQLPDVQCAWLLLAFCAAPRAQHLLRNVPPADILPYARGHDDAVWAAVEGLLGDQGPGEGEDWAAARQVAFLPPSLRPPFLCSGAGFTGSILGGVGRCARGVARANRQRPAYVQQRRRRAKLLQRAGRADWSGRLAPVAPTRQPLRVNSAWETHVGSDTPFSHFTLPFENACCFLPWLRPLAPSFTLSPVRMLVCAAFGCPCPSRPCTVARKADTAVGPRRGFVVERAWVQVAREAVGPEGSRVYGWVAAA